MFIWGYLSIERMPSGRTVWLRICFLLARHLFRFSWSWGEGSAESQGQESFEVITNWIASHLYLTFFIVEVCSLYAIATVQTHRCHSDSFYSQYLHCQRRSSPSKTNSNHWVTRVNLSPGCSVIWIRYFYLFGCSFWYTRGYLDLLLMTGYSLVSLAINYPSSICFHKFAYLCLSSVFLSKLLCFMS